MAEGTAPPPTDQPATGWQALAGRITQWPLSRKLAMGAVSLISLALFAVIIIQARTAEYQLLYANLAESDAAAIVEWLKEQKIPYQLSDNGKKIAIPATNVHEARLSLAGAGLPQGGGVGFEIFDKQSFALTYFVQKVNYTRALQGELARTIGSLGPVETARVHLAIPEKRLFKDQQNPATASIILTLRPGRVLSENQVQGILHLVSGSIEGLAPDNITIIDQNGNVLSRSPNQGLAGNLSPDMLEFQLEVEKNLEERAQSLLNATLGPDLSMARVTAELDFSQSEKTEEHYDPEEPVIRSEQINEEKSGSEIVGGIPGVQSNLQGNSAPPATATPPSSRMQRTTNYEISKVVSKTINPVGTIKKISVAVLVADKKTAGKKNEPPRYEPRSADELNSLKNMISSALGLDMKRGDQIEVTSMPFTDTSKTREVEAVAQESTFNQYLPLIRYSLLLLGGLLVYLLMVRPLIKTLRQDVTEHYKTVEQLEAEQAMEGTGEGKRRYSADPLLRIREEVSDDPTLVTHVVKTWINEK